MADELKHLLAKRIEAESELRGADANYEAIVSRRLRAERAANQAREAVIAAMDRIVNEELKFGEGDTVSPETEAPQVEGDINDSDDPGTED